MFNNHRMASKEEDTQIKIDGTKDKTKPAKYAKKINQLFNRPLCTFCQVNKPV